MSTGKTYAKVVVEYAINLLSPPVEARSSRVHRRALFIHIIVRSDMGLLSPDCFTKGVRRVAKGCYTTRYGLSLERFYC